MQITILVIAGLITALISIAGTLIWTGINTQSTRNYNRNYMQRNGVENVKPNNNNK